MNEPGRPPPAGFHVDNCDCPAQAASTMRAMGAGNVVMKLYFSGGPIAESETDAFIDFCEQDGWWHLSDVCANSEPHIQQRLLHEVTDGRLAGNAAVFSLMLPTIRSADVVTAWMDRHGHDDLVCQQVGSNPQVARNLFDTTTDARRQLIISTGAGGAVARTPGGARAIARWMQRHWPAGTILQQADEHRQPTLTTDGQEFFDTVAKTEIAQSVLKESSWLTALRLVAFDLQNSTAWEQLTEKLAKRKRISAAEAGEAQCLLALMAPDLWAHTSTAVRFCSELQARSRTPIPAAAKLAGQATAATARRAPTTDELAEAHLDRLAGDDMVAWLAELHSRPQEPALWMRLGERLTHMQLTDAQRISLLQAIITDSGASPLTGIWKRLACALDDSRLATVLTNAGLHNAIETVAWLRRNGDQRLLDVLFWQVPVGNPLVAAAAISNTDARRRLAGRVRTELGDSQELVALAATWEGTIQDLVAAVQTSRTPAAQTERPAVG